MKECVFVLSAEAVADELRAPDAVFVRALYEVPAPEGWGSERMREPADYLSREDIDAIYAELDDRQRRAPWLRLRQGETLAQWTAGLDTPPAIWLWLTALAPYWHIAERLVRLVERVIETEAPQRYRILAGDPEGAWAAEAIERIMAARWPQIERSGPPPAPAAPPAPAPKQPETPLDLEALRAAPAVVRACKQVEQIAEDAVFRIAGAPARHVVLLTRGARGAYWLHSPVTGQSHLLDEYSEGMPDALAQACEAADARLTIIYDGPEPVSSATEPLYGQRSPHLVVEMSSNVIARVSSSMRVATNAHFTAAVDALCDDPAFQSAFAFHGVDLFPLFREYVSRSIANLATLHLTQHEAWRVLVKALKPDVFIGGRLEAKPWISLAAHEAGASAVSIKLGIGEEMMPSMIALKAEGEYAHEAYPDAFLVWGEEQARYLSDRLPEYAGRIVPVGRARSDTFVRESALQDRAAARARLGLPERAQIILYGANHRSRYGKWPEQQWGSVCFSRESYVACFDALVACAAEIEDGWVLVKPHPADDLVFIGQCIAERGRGIASMAPPASELHNVEALGMSDVFVSTVSSMFAEAASVGRPSVNIWRPDVNLLYERGRWEKYNAIAVGVESFEEMAGAVRLLLTDDDVYREETTRALSNMKRYFGELDAGNAARAARVALELRAGSA